MYTGRSEARSRIFNSFPVVCFEGCQLQCFLFLCDAFFLLKELWKSKEELRVPLQNWKEKKSLNRVFLLEVHHSHSLSESCRMRNLRLVSKSQMSCFRGEVSSYFWSKLGSTLNFKSICIYMDFLSPARAILTACALLPLTRVLGHLLMYSSTSHFPLFLVHMFSVLFLAPMVCLPLPLCL